MSRDAYQNQFAFFETRIEHWKSKERGHGERQTGKGIQALRVGMGMGESETESMWESREVEVVKWKSELDSISNSNSRIQYAHIVPVTVRVISTLSRIV